MYRILVVDDLADNLFLLQTLLEMEGYQVDIAKSGESALSQIRNSPPDLVLLDVMMPGMNGYEVTQQIRQTLMLADLPILLITAHGEEHISKGLALGANDFVSKPIDFNCLTERLEEFLQAATAVPDRGLPPKSELSSPISGHFQASHVRQVTAAEMQQRAC